MAIINCPECNNKVSDKAESCPNCAFPINRKTNLNKAPENREGCFLETLNIGCLLIFIFIAFIVIIGAMNS
jgi:hypothetical protein